MKMSGLIHQILEYLTSLGPWGIMLGLMIEVIPSEIVLAYGGILVYNGTIPFIEAVIFGTIGGVIAQIFVYWVGRYGGRPFLEKFGKYILIHKKHIDVAEHWFNRYGTGVIFTARFIPVVRHAISIPAGITRMPLGKFTLLTTLAVIPWSILFVYLGTKLGELGQSFENISSIAGPYTKPILIAAVLLTVAYLVFKLWRGRRSGAAGTEQAAVSAVPQRPDRFASLGPAYRVLSGSAAEGATPGNRPDYVVIGPNGVFAVRCLKAGLPGGTEADEVREQGRREETANLLYRDEYWLKELLRGAGKTADVSGVLCVSGTRPELASTEGGKTGLEVGEERLVPYLEGRRAKKPLAVKDVEAVAAIVDAAIRSGR